MDIQLTLPAAFLVGMLGGVHCVGMCGGIVGMLSGGLSPAIRQSRWRLVSAALAYNTGRILSYTLAGLLLGALGQQVSALGILVSFPVGSIVAGVFMILFGVYLAGWWHALQVFEKAGSRLWARIEPLGRRLVPVQGAGQACLLGMLWGWLPCGMVYAVLALALASGDALYGGLIMAVFGLGTLPLMLAMVFMLGSLVRVLQGGLLRNLAGITVMAFGVYTLFAMPAGHDHHMVHAPAEHTHHPHDHGEHVTGSPP